MKKWIRWQGIIIFVGVVAAIVIFVSIFAGSLVAKAVETAGTRAVGARVDVADADVSLFPAGLVLEGVQVTNPDAPMTNAVEIGRVGLTLDIAHLLSRKIIVREMIVGGVRFNTQREKSGAVRPKEKTASPSPDSEETGLQLPSFDIKDVPSLLAKEQLSCLNKIEGLRADMNGQKKKFEQQMDSLPDKKTFDAYEARVKKLKSGSSGFGNILGKVKEAAALKKEIERDIDKVKNVQKEVQASVSGFQGQVAKMARCPQEDFQRIRDKYGLSPQGLGNITNLILGPKYAGWVSKGLAWYEKIAPMLEGGDQGAAEPDVDEPLRGKGRNVKFKEAAALPDFLIERTDVSMTIPAGDMAGIVRNITPDQDLLGEPLTWELSGKELSGLDSALVDGVFDHVVPVKAKDTVRGRISGYRLENLSLSDSSQLAVELEGALLDCRFDISIQGDVIDSSMNFVFEKVRFSDPKTDQPSLIGDAVASALSGVSGFAVQTKISGTLDNYDIKLKSDLDQVLSKAVSGLVKQHTAKFEKQLKQAIFAKTAAPMESLKGDMGGFDLINKELKNRLNMGNSMLGSLDKML
jgi:uncharacterized protein (TIGR03545 family)